MIVPPPRHGDQYRRQHLLDVSGATAVRRVRRDDQGNVVTWLRADAVNRAIEFRLTALVERVRGDGPAVAAPSALTDPGLLRPTRLTAADDRIRELASQLADPADTPLEQAARICQQVHSAISYQHGVTSVQTTAAQALAGGQGVCQDFAHVMLAVCHVIGLPRKYQLMWYSCRLLSLSRVCLAPAIRRHNRAARVLTGLVGWSPDLGGLRVWVQTGACSSRSPFHAGIATATLRTPHEQSGRQALPPDTAAVVAGDPEAGAVPDNLNVDIPSVHALPRNFSRSHAST